MTSFAARRRSGIISRLRAGLMRPVGTQKVTAATTRPGGPTGTAMLHEAVLQLRGEAAGRQVDGAKVALAHLVGGGSIATVNLLGVEGVGT